MYSALLSAYNSGGPQSWQIIHKVHYNKPSNIPMRDSLPTATEQPPSRSVLQVGLLLTYNTVPGALPLGVRQPLPVYFLGHIWLSVT